LKKGGNLKVRRKGRGKEAVSFFLSRGGIDGITTKLGDEERIIRN